MGVSVINILQSKNFIDFRYASFAGIIVIILFSLFLVLLGNHYPYNTYFSNIFSPAVNLVVALFLFYAAKTSKIYGSKIYWAWIFLAVAQTSFLLGDMLWGLYETGIFFSNSSFADFFYILYYFLFIVGILFFSSETLTPLNQFKMFFDMTIVIISAALIFLTLLVLPQTQSINGFSDEFIVAFFYVLLDFFLLIALISLAFKIINKKKKTTLFLLALGVLIQILADFIYTFYTINGTFTSGSLVDSGWVAGYVFIGLAAISQIKNQDINFGKYIPESFSYFTKINWSLYTPLILVAISYICLIWAYRNLISQYLYLLDYGVGIVVFLVIIRQIIALRENKTLYNAARDEISKREIIEEELQRSEKKYREIVENASEGIISTDSDGMMIFSNGRFMEMLGYQENELKERSIFSLMDEESAKIAKTCMVNVKNGKKGQNELRLVKKEGTVLHVLINVSPIMDGSQYKGCLALISDITEIKEAESQIKHSLNEKEALLREVHHRVRNNMQVISSMLSLQSNYIKDERMREIFNESRDRIKSMALVHEKLYNSIEMSKIEVKYFIFNLMSYLSSSYPLKHDLVDFKIDAENIYFDIDTAVPVSLIINELVTNSLKYAFPKDAKLENKNEISVKIKSEDDKYIMEIKDNGIGLPQNFNLSNISTLGLNIVCVLVNQLNGEIEVLKTSGTCFKIIF